MRKGTACFVKLILATVAWVALTATVAHAQTRRAVIVGINSYHATGTEAKTPVKAGIFSRLAVMGTFTRRDLDDLEASVNDARAMKQLLIDRFGFEEQNIVLLFDQEATADNILMSLQHHLVDEARPGDIGLFYYAGHGSRISNRKTDDPTGLDQTIVPADAWRGTPDIRDKELVRIFRPAAQKGVKLTIIADSCHSGSIVRSSARVREVPSDEQRYVEDSPDLGPDGNKLPVPEDLGALVLSAAQDDQPAYERTGDSEPHGVFTWALLQVLQSVGPNERLDRIYQRVRALTESERPDQEPVMAGRGRGEKTLLGESSGVSTLVTAAVERVNEREIILQAGSASGLREHCVLKRGATQADAPVTRVEIVRILSPGSSIARVTAGSIDNVHPGDLFELEQWIVPQTEKLRVYLPENPPSLPAIKAAVAEAKTLTGLDWIDDPTVRRPDVILVWEDGGWVLERGRKRISLGQTFTSEQLRQKIGNGKVRFFFSVPLPLEVGRALELGEGSPNQAVQLVSRCNEAQYMLSGRLGDKGLSFAWTSQSGSDEEFAAMTVARNKRSLGPPVDSLMPLRSDWMTLDEGGATKMGAALKDFALGIARVKGWLQVQPPPVANPFPYYLAFRRAGPQKTVEGTELNAGHYQMYFKADKGLDRTRYVSSRIVYVFIIDRTGAGHLLFPELKKGDQQNEFPVMDADGAAPDEIPLGEIIVGAPFGYDTYIVLAIDKRLPDFSVLDFTGVQAASEQRDAQDPVTALILGLQKGTRDSSSYVPIDWSLERTIMHSSE